MPCNIRPRTGSPAFLRTLYSKVMIFQAILQLMFVRCTTAVAGMNDAEKRSNPTTSQVRSVELVRKAPAA